jgi:2Fe-2S ferredoxin
MSLRGLHEFDDQKTLDVKFILQDPHALTSKDDKEVTVKAAPGQNLLNIAIEAGIEIEHSCGGVCACSTCHVWVNKGAEVLSDQDDAEADRLDMAPMVKTKSRLSCQAVIQAGARPGQIQIEVEVPAWNRNLIKEAHHD